MRFRPPVTVHVKVRTPLFVWDGSTLGPLDFVVDGDLVHVIDNDRFFQALSPMQQRAYLEWIDPVLEHLGRLETQIEQAGKDLEGRRKLSQQKRQVASALSLEQFLRQRLGQNAAAFIKSRGCVAYSVRWAVRPGADGFRSFIKEAGYRPYVPGTELKGALRTALLFALLGREENYAVLAEELAGFQTFFQSGALPGEKMKRLTKIAGEVEETALRGCKNDAKYDLLRLLHVGDAELLSPASLQVRALESVGTGRFTRTLAEALETETAFSFRLALASVKEVGWALEELGLAQKARDLSLARLLEACYRRSAAILESDEEYFRSNPVIMREIGRLKTENAPQSPLLRLGGGQGFLSTTIDLHVRRRDPRLYDRAIREGVSFQRHWRTQQDNFPKTRRVVSDGHGNPVTLPGWIKMEIEM